MRAIWTGSIAFGLVNIPIELHRALRETRPHFRLLHAKDKSPVRFDRVCEREDRSVTWSEVVKGYEYTKGKFVVLTPEDLKRAALEKTRTFDILHFVPGTDIDDRFFETPYYAMPAKGGERAYVVLREALRQAGKTAVGKIMLRETQHLAALEAIGDALVLTMMRFPDELADLSDFRFPSAGGQRPKEVQMAKALIDQLSAKWSPEDYKDDYQANLLRLIRAKLKGTSPRLKEEAPAHEGKVVDLMERLQQSLAGKRSATAAHVRRESRRPPKTARKGGSRKIA
jgi:DNA end-binding protein Ku